MTLKDLTHGWGNIIYKDGEEWVRRTLAEARIAELENERDRWRDAASFMADLDWFSAEKIGLVPSGEYDGVWLLKPKENEK